MQQGSLCLLIGYIVILKFTSEPYSVEAGTNTNTMPRVPHYKYTIMCVKTHLTYQGLVYIPLQ